MKNKAWKYATVLIGAIGSAMIASAGIVLDTLPGNDSAGLVADSGQTWKTGKLGSSNGLKTIEVATRSRGAGGGEVYLAVYENKAPSGNAAQWSKGRRVAVSSNTQDMSRNGIVNTFHFRYQKLASNQRYLFTFVDAAGKGVDVGVGVKKGTGNAEQSAYSKGSAAFSGEHTIASRVTLGSTSPLRFKSATTIQSNIAIAKVGIHGVAALEITSDGGVPVNSIASLTYTLEGTTDPSDIEDVRLYEGGETFDHKSAILLASQRLPAASTSTFTLNRKIIKEKQYLWLAVKLTGGSEAGDRIDAEITKFTLAGRDVGARKPTVSSPQGALTVDSTTLYSTVVRKEGDDGSAFYRIPGLVTTNKGTLIAAFDVRWGGGYDLPADMDTAVMRSTDGGVTWGPMQIIMDYDKTERGSRGNGVGDPTIFVDSVSGRIWCAALWSFGNNAWNGSGPGLNSKQTGQLVLCYSDDDGLTWSEPVSITPEVKDPAWRLLYNGPGKGICTRDGVLVLPTQFRENDRGKTARSNFVYSTDRGKTWKTAPAAFPTGTEWTSESQIVELENGDLLISMRNYDVKRKQRLWCVYSWDHEKETIADGSWGERWYDETCPIVMASVEHIKGTVKGKDWYGILFSNPDSKKREKMTVRLSLENGKAGSWDYKRKIDDLPAAYSCMTILPDGDIGILYETGETASISRLVFARFPLEWLVGAKDTDEDGISDFEDDVLRRKSGATEQSAAGGPGGSFVKATKSYRPDDIDETGALDVRERKVHAWRGERVNSQILLWGGDMNVRAEVAASDLVGPSGRVIPASQVRLDFLKFIEMNSRDRYATDPAHVELVPDMLNGSKPASIEAGKVQPLWVGVDIPRTAKPGVYRGTIKAKLGFRTLSFPYVINVLDAVVPEPKDWRLNLNLWMHPQATLHYYLGCKGHGQDKSKWEHKGCADMMWSDQHLAWYKPTLELLRDAGVGTITVNLVKDPWRSAHQLSSEQAQTNYSYDEMIHWRRKKDGTFTFDFRDFEKFVGFCMKMGIDDSIECYSMLPWIRSKHSAVTCYDESTKKEIIYHFKSWKEYEQVWSSFMEAFVPVLVKNGWFEKTRIGVDERGLGNIPHVLKVLEKFKHKGRMLAISAAANRTHHFDDSVGYISMHGGARSLANNKWTEKQFADWADSRREKGLLSTWYTCTGTYPGNFGNSRPAESLFIGWYSARIKADGYLRWSVDSWNDNPTHTTDHKVYETGDTFQLYPGDRDAKIPFTRLSVRFELFRQGLVDYEKIQVLRKEHPESRKAIDAMLEKVTRPATPAQIKGNSSLVYDESTESDFSDLLESVQAELLAITLKYVR